MGDGFCIPKASPFYVVTVTDLVGIDLCLYPEGFPLVCFVCDSSGGYGLVFPTIHRTKTISNRHVHTYTDTDTVYMRHHACLLPFDDEIPRFLILRSPRSTMARTSYTSSTGCTTILAGRRLRRGTT